MSRKEALQRLWDSGDYLISIYGMDEEAPDFGNSPMRVASFRFNDDSKSMTSEQARDILRHAIECHASTGRLFVHCQAGISRSAGVAEALVRVGLFEWDERDDKIWQANGRKGARYMPNAHVVSMMMRAAGVTP